MTLWAKIYGCLGVGLLATLFASQATGADLRKFAEESTGQKPPEAKKKSKTVYRQSAAESAFGSGTYPSEEGGVSFLGSFYAWLVASPFKTHAGDPAIDEDGADGAPVRHGIFPRHLPGEATALFVRFDYNRQSVDSETDADDLRIELGYKMLAFHARTTMYSNDTLGQDLDINQFYGVLRYGGYRPGFLPGTFEAGLGLGVSQINFEDALGTIDDSTIAFTLVGKYYPVQWFGVEFRPAWYRWDGAQVGDYDLSASVGYRFVQLRGGYRWLGFSGSEDLNGPYLGLSASF